MDVSRTSSLIVKPGENLSSSLREDYSRMKYGDPLATKSLAQLLFNRISNSKGRDAEIFQKRNLVLLSSACGVIPTAAHSLMLEFSKLLLKEGIQHELAKIERLQSLDRIDYATLGGAERSALMKARELTINNKNKSLIDNQPLIVIDDLCATGSHERAIVNCLLEHCIVPEVKFLYVFEFSEELRLSDPMLESVLNSCQVKDLDDLLDLILKSNVSSYLNARVVKFILDEGGRKPKSLRRFLSLAPVDYIQRLYRAVMSNDMLVLRQTYSCVVDMLRAFLHGTRGRIDSAYTVTQ